MGILPQSGAPCEAGRSAGGDQSDLSQLVGSDLSFNVGHRGQEFNSCRHCYHDVEQLRPSATHGPMAV